MAVLPTMAVIQIGRPFTGGRCSHSQSQHAGDSGEPAEPMARSADRSVMRRRSMFACRTPVWKAALAPKKVTPVSPTNCHRRVQSGDSVLPAGWPSKRQRVVPPSSPPTCRFHTIPPVDAYQWNRSPVSTVAPRLLCSVLSLSDSSTMPPWPCTMGLGRPVVPLA